MKKLLIILATMLLFASCKNNSFENYNKWCNETIEKEKVAFTFMVKFTIFKTEPIITDTVPRLSFGDSGGSYIYFYDKSINILNEYMNSEHYEIQNLTYSIIKYTEPRCKATFEGYNEWLITQI